MSAKIATAPISWGVSEVPGWGVQLPPERVLSEMAELGFTATEIGADGFLPEAPADKAATLREYGLEAIGSFVPVVMHRADVDPLPRLERELEAYAAAGGDVLVVCAVTGLRGYDATREVLTDGEWTTLFGNLDRITRVASAQGVRAALHPHVGTVVETADDVTRVLEGSTIPFCFDTGHLMIGGTDPVAFAAAHADRIAHTHLKDVSLEWMHKVKNGEISYYDACIAGLYTPVGQGDVDVRAIVTSLVESGYNGWIVLEQDKIVQEYPELGEGPIEDARASVNYLRGILSALAVS
ncbi:inosose dehydratase [Cryobacterium roopkundense]|uniref:Inosose dehydratase n=1 Tax=Cryobacterium roopkundense TaxID=1001240 RepID=A0A099J2B5_9MICO|nr:sugar phosphate isomerase/epimerase [Cryobacterium roopkundense]KGJ72594.1 inosose dehydratase [Cryobacterium roopkundense]MBB5642899.1 inosose dehydratase [Cryobacterium roopkundense]